MQSDNESYTAAAEKSARTDVMQRLHTPRDMHLETPVGGEANLIILRWANRERVGPPSVNYWRKGD